MKQFAILSFYYLRLVSHWGLFLLFLAPGVDGSSSMQNPVHPLERLSGLYTGPYFDSSTATNITTQLGTHAYLPCKVKQLGNKSVSFWNEFALRADWFSGFDRCLGFENETPIFLQSIGILLSRMNVSRRSLSNRRILGRCRWSTSRPGTPASMSARCLLSRKWVPLSP